MRFTTQFWGCLVIGNVYNATEHPVMAIIWIALAGILLYLDNYHD